MCTYLTKPASCATRSQNSQFTFLLRRFPVQEKSFRLIGGGVGCPPLRHLFDIRKRSEVQALWRGAELRLPFVYRAGPNACNLDPPRGTKQTRKSNQNALWRTHRISGS